MTCDMFIFDASNECDSERAETMRLPGTCKIQITENRSMPQGMMGSHEDYILEISA